MTLPSATTGALVASVEREAASASTVAVTGNIRGVGSSTVTLSLASESEMFLGSGGSWWPVAGHKTLSSLQALFLGVPSGTASAGMSPSPRLGRGVGVGLQRGRGDRDVPKPTGTTAATDTPNRPWRSRH